MLIIITGASGVGKTSIIPFIKKCLHSSYLVFDFDALGKPYDGKVGWKDEHLEKMNKITHQNQSKDIHTIICGLIQPQWVENNSISDLKIEHYYILLTVSKTERKRRLNERNALLSLIEDEEELDKFPDWMEKYASKYSIIDTTHLEIPQVVTEVIKLICEIVSRIPF